MKSVLPTYSHDATGAIVQRLPEVYSVWLAVRKYCPFFPAIFPTKEMEVFKYPAF